MEELAGKVAVVTGAASGIGRALAVRFAAENMRVVLADIDEPAVAEAVSELAASGARVIGLRTDVADYDEVAALRDAAVAEFGAVHVVCNNAGVGVGGPIWTVPIESWRWMLGVNLWGVIHGVHAFTPLLVEQGEGHIVNTASAAGLVSAPFLGPYVTSKHAVVALSESLLLDLAGTGVGVSALCPMWVRTRIHESSRSAPADVLAAEEARGLSSGDGISLLSGVIESGLDPAVVADQVAAAVQGNRFYVLPHPQVKVAAVDRARRIAEDEQPGVPQNLA